MRVLEQATLPFASENISRYTYSYVAWSSYTISKVVDVCCCLGRKKKRESSRKPDASHRVGWSESELFVEVGVLWLPSSGSLWRPNEVAGHVSSLASEQPAIHVEVMEMLTRGQEECWVWWCVAMEDGRGNEQDDKEMGRREGEGGAREVLQNIYVRALL
jgi:hypothetical protein